MLRWLTVTARKRTALFVAVLYPLCVVAPYAAAALPYSSKALHCLTEQHAAPHEHAVDAHVHADGSSHRHQSSTDQTDTGDSDSKKIVDMSCCGLFSISALTADVEAFAALPQFGETFDVLPPREIGGQPPKRLIRPPIV